MKKLGLLTLTLMLSLTVFCQNDTLVPTKCLPIPTFRLIVKDLISGDQAKEELRLTNEQLVETEKKVSFLDSVNFKQNIIINLKDSVIFLKDKKYELLKEQTDRLEKALRKEKQKGIFTKISSFTIIGTLTYLLLKK